MAVGQHDVHVTVNGAEVSQPIEPRLLLSDWLRDGLGLIGTKVGCEQGACGACSVLLDGELVRSCLMFAVQVDGHEVTTIEGLRDLPEVERLFDAMTEAHALQCGYCTPGMVVTTYTYLRRSQDRSPDDVSFREFIGGNLCRCTGYEGLVRAAQLVRDSR